jgi:uncharacterized protein YjbI with pentapeptide repeats
MNDQILKIMEMNRDGKISDDQAAQLLSALAEGGPTPATGRAPPPASHQSHDDGGQDDRHMRGGAAGLSNLGTVIADFMQDKIGAVKNRTIDFNGESHLVDDDSRCEDNTMYGSDVGDVQLQKAEFCQNTLNATRFNNVTIKRGRMSSCNIKGAAVDGVSVTDGQLEKSSFTGAHIANFAIEGTRVAHCSFTGSRIDEWNITGSQVGDSSFNCVNLAEVEVSNGSEIQDLSMNGVNGTNVVIHHSHFRHVNFSSITLERVQFDKAELEHVTFSGHVQSQTVFRRVLLRDAKFRLREGIGSLVGFKLEDMEVKNCNFVNCDFEGCTMRGFTLEDVACENVDFMNRTIENLQDFLRVIEESRNR